MDCVHQRLEKEPAPSNRSGRIYRCADCKETITVFKAPYALTEIEGAIDLARSTGDYASAVETIEKVLHDATV